MSNSESYEPQVVGRAEARPSATPDEMLDCLESIEEKLEKLIELGEKQLKALDALAKVQDTYGAVAQLARTIGLDGGG